MSANRSLLKRLNGASALIPVGAAAMIVIVAAIGLLYGEIARRDQEARRVVWGGLCPVVGLTMPGDLRASCDGTDLIVRDDAVRFSYALNPGPLSCVRWASGRVVCQLRPFKQ